MKINATNFQFKENIGTLYNKKQLKFPLFQIINGHIPNKRKKKKNKKNRRPSLTKINKVTQKD